MFHTIQALYLAPPGGAPAGRITSPGTYFVLVNEARFLAALLNVLDYTQVYSRNLAAGETFFADLSRFGLPSHLMGFKHESSAVHSYFKRNLVRRGSDPDFPALPAG